MGEQPLISIIVPVYNVERYLRECLDSICAQKGILSEIIVVDDGSTDGSAAICDEYAKEYANLKVIHKQNGGLASARNAGLDVMKGDYVGFVDSDDYIATDMYEALYKAMVQTECRVACCSWYRVIDGEVEGIERPVTEPVVLSKKDAIRSLMLNTGITYSACDKLFKAELFKGIRFPKENLPSEDMPCIYEVLKNIDKIAYIGETKYYYRVVMESITKKEFSSKNMSTFYYEQDICGDVMRNLPELRDEAFFSLIQCITSSYARLIRDGKKKECKREKRYIEKFLWKNIGSIVKNPYLSTNGKLVALSVPTGLYGSLMKVRVKVKAIRLKG